MLFILSIIINVLQIRGLTHIDVSYDDDDENAREDDGINANEINSGFMVGANPERGQQIVPIDLASREASATTRRRAVVPRRVTDIIRDSTEKWMSASQADDDEYFQEMQAIGYMKEGKKKQ